MSTKANDFETFVLRAFMARMEREGEHRRSTFNRADPTQCDTYEAYVFFDHRPNLHKPGTCAPVPGWFHVKVHAIWGLQIAVTPIDGNYKVLTARKRELYYDNGFADRDGTVAVMEFMKAALTEGTFTTKEPIEVDEAEETANEMYCAEVRAGWDASP